MRRYRCFLLDAQGTIRGAELIGAENDADAWHKATALLGERPHFRDVQVWEQRRGVELAGGEEADGNRVAPHGRLAEMIIRKLCRPDAVERRRVGG